MKLSRRQVLAYTATAVAGLAAMRIPPAHATAEDAMAKITEFTGGVEPATGKLVLTAPEIAENGNTVPVSVFVESPMTEEDYVESVTLLAEGNPNPDVITFHFTPMSGTATATTRMRLAKTQKVVALAKTSTGAVYMDKKEVKVTIGGCGG